MKIFKKNNDKDRIVPCLPAGNRGVEPHDLVNTIFYLKNVSMVTTQRFGHGDKYSISVAEIQSVGRVPFLSPLIFNLFTAPVCRSVRTIYMREEKIYAPLVILEDFGISGFPFTSLTPFTEMMVYSTPVRDKQII